MMLEEKNEFLTVINKTADLYDKKNRASACERVLGRFKAP